MARVAVCAVEPLDDGKHVVLAIIIAESSDTPQAGTFLVDVDHTACGVGWLYDPIVNDFTDPSPPVEPEAQPDEESDESEASPSADEAE